MEKRVLLSIGLRIWVKQCCVSFRAPAMLREHVGILPLFASTVLFLMVGCGVVTDSPPLASFDVTENSAAAFGFGSSAEGSHDDDGIGACCFGDLCKEFFPDICVGQGGEFQGEGTECEEEPCVPVPNEVASLFGDCDNDGQTDLEELLLGTDPCDPTDDSDIDDDGILNGDDLDVDGDGCPNAYDRDVDGDGILNRFDPDIDGDGIPNNLDDDDDGDGVPDDLDDDANADGIPD